MAGEKVLFVQEIVFSDRAVGSTARNGTMFISGSKLWFVAGGAHKLVTST